MSKLEPRTRYLNYAMLIKKIKLLSYFPLLVTFLVLKKAHIEEKRSFGLTGDQTRFVSYNHTHVDSILNYMLTLEFSA